LGHPEGGGEPGYRPGHRSVIPEMYELTLNKVAVGRAVSIVSGGGACLGRNYAIHSLDLNGGASTLLARVPCPVSRILIEPVRLLCRLLRHEIRSFCVLPNGNKVAASRQWMYFGGRDDVLLKRAGVSGFSPDLKPPMMITADSRGRILWGEYWGNPERKRVRIFLSTDEGRSYAPVWEFKPGEVKHVHNIEEDPDDDCYWVFVGDHGKEPGIGRLSRDLKHFDWLVKGEQRYRLCAAFVFPDRIVYGTDTEKESNGIYAIDKKSGKAEQLCRTPGSCIYASKFGKWFALSTSVEYFEQYDTRHATLWVSADTLQWHKVLEIPKDIWSRRYFQFGSIVLPRGRWEDDRLVLSGQALKGMDNQVYVGRIRESAS
jgi:hypothetical protein